MNDNPIFILGCHKSGTTLLRNLLDGHKDLFAVPTETHFLANAGYWVKYSYRRNRPQNLSMEEIKKRLIDWIDLRNREDNIIADGFTRGKWNIEVLKDHVMNNPSTNLRELSDLFYSGLYKSLHEQELPGDKRIVEKSVENSEFVSDLNLLYPNAKFIRILRNPYSNLVSLRKYSTKNEKYLNFPFLRNPIRSMYDSFYDLYKNIRTFKHYKLIKYEDLLLNTSQIMREISEFIEIEFNEGLLQPTVISENWEGNSIRGQKFQGISSVNLTKWESEITDFEIHAVNKLFNFVIEDFNYKKLRPKNKSYWKRAPKEGMRNYFLNRFLMIDLT